MKNEFDEMIKSQQKMRAEEKLQECINFKSRLLMPTEDKNGPCGIISRTVIERLPPTFQITFQIFHTNMKKLSSRKHLHAMDNDARRPMFMTSTNDWDRHTKFFLKNIDLMRAFEIMIVEPVADKTVVFSQCGSKSQTELHMFIAWKHHTEKQMIEAMGQDATTILLPNWCTSTVEEVSKGKYAVVNRGLLTAEDFNAVLSNEKTVKDCGIDMDIRIPESFTAEGKEWTFDSMHKHAEELYEKEVLEDYEPTTMH